MAPVRWRCTVSANRQAQLDAVIAVACRLAEHDPASMIALLVGATTLACGRSVDPAATLAIAIDSLTSAREMCIEHLAARKAVTS